MVDVNESPTRVRSFVLDSNQGTKEVITQWVICRRQKRGGVLSRAVRGAGIPPAVRVRFLTETSNAKRSRANL